MNYKFFIAITWITSLLYFFKLGYSKEGRSNIYNERTTTTANNKKSNHRAKNRRKSPNHQTASMLDENKISEAIDMALKTGSFCENYTTWSMNSDWGSNNLEKLKSLASFWEKIGHFSESELQQLLNEMVLDSKEYFPRPYAEMIISRLAEINPHKIFDNFFKSGHKSILSYRTAMEVWAKNDSQAALEWYLQNKRNFSGWHRFGDIIIKHMAKVNLEHALDTIKSLTHTEQLLVYRGQLTAIYPDSLDGITKDMEISEAIKHILHGRNPDNKTFHERIELASSITSPKVRTVVMDEISKNWLKDDPYSAAEWILENEENTQKAIEQVVDGWNALDRKSLSLFIQSLSSEQQDQANALLITNYTYSNPYFAAKSLEQIKDRELYKATLNKVFKPLYDSDQNDAISFLKSKEHLSQMEKEKVLETLDIDVSLLK